MIISEKPKYNTYDFEDGCLCFITTADRAFSRVMDADVKKLLREVHKNNFYIMEYKLVALNRWLMKKDDKLDFNCVKSKQNRLITLRPRLLVALGIMQYKPK